MSLTFSALEKALCDTQLSLHPSQVQGLICGIICGHKPVPEGWEQLITGREASEKTLEVLQSLYHKSHKQLKDFLFEFQLLLPDDANTLSERAEALTLWCQGFLTGLKMMHIPIVDREPSDVTEAISDLIEIAKMNYDAVVSNEEDENAYMELVEYVRMAIILIYQDADLENTTATKEESSDQMH